MEMDLRILWIALFIDLTVVSTAKSPSTQGTEALTTAMVNMSVKLSPSKMAKISPSTQTSAGRTTSTFISQPQFGTVGGGKTANQSSFPSQTAYLVSSIGSQGVSNQPAPSSVNHTSSASPLSEHAHSNSTAAPTIMSSSPTSQAQTPSPSPKTRTTTSTFGIQPSQPSTVRGGETANQSRFPSQSVSLVSSIGSQGVTTQPDTSSVNHTASASPLSEHFNSTAAPTTMSTSPTTQAQIPSPSPSLHCKKFTVYDKDCKETCSNAGGTVTATQLCSLHFAGSSMIFNQTAVKCDDYCPPESGAEAVRSLLLAVVFGIQLIMLLNFA